MRAKKPAVWCEQCGGTTLSCCAEWILFDRLIFCSPDCRADYQLSMRRRQLKVVALTGKTAIRADAASPRIRARSRPRSRATA